MAARLNGWQRLWVVISALYLVPVAAFTVLFWPTPATTWHRDEFIASMPAELREHVAGAYANEWSWKEALKAQESSPRPREAKRVTKDKAVPPPPGFVLVSGPVSFPNGAVLDVLVAKEGDPELDARVGPAYWAVVEATARSAQWTMVWQMALVWLVPCLSLYALGVAVAWIRRGFRGNPREP